MGFAQLGAPCSRAGFTRRLGHQPSGYQNGRGDCARAPAHAALCKRNCLIGTQNLPLGPLKHTCLPSWDPPALRAGVGHFSYSTVDGVNVFCLKFKRLITAGKRFLTLGVRVGPPRKWLCVQRRRRSVWKGGGRVRSVLRGMRQACKVSYRPAQKGGGCTAQHSQLRKHKSVEETAGTDPGRSSWLQPTEGGEQGRARLRLASGPLIDAA